LRELNGVQEIKDDMAAQLAQVRELEKNDPDLQQRFQEAQKAYGLLFDDLA
jgi:hypothetical protein